MKKKMIHSLRVLFSELERGILCGFRQRQSWKADLPGNTT